MALLSTEAIRSVRCTSNEHIVLRCADTNNSRHKCKSGFHCPVRFRKMTQHSTTTTMHLMKSRKNNKKIEKVFQLKTTEK